jgi:putative ABC transport system ATP-binding protein
MVLRPDEAGRFDFFPKNGKALNVMDAWQHRRLSHLAHTRMLHIGYVLQTGGLFPFLSVRENIGISRRGLGLPVEEAVKSIAQSLHIERHLNKLPGQLSVGERQRVAIARSLFNKLTDEYGVTLIMATHDWGKLGERGFRRVEFGFKQDPNRGNVRAMILG